MKPIITLDGLKDDICVLVNQPWNYSAHKQHPESGFITRGFCRGGGTKQNTTNQATSPRSRGDLKTWPAGEERRASAPRFHFPDPPRFPCRSRGGGFGKCPPWGRRRLHLSPQQLPRGRGAASRPRRAPGTGQGTLPHPSGRCRPGVPRHPPPPSLVPAALTHCCTRGRRSACARRSGGPGRSRRRRRGGRAAGVGAAGGRRAAGGPAAGLRPCWRAPAAAGREQTRQQRRREGDVAAEEGPARPGPAATAGGGGGGQRPDPPSRRHPGPASAETEPPPPTHTHTAVPGKSPARFQAPS